MVVRSPSRWLTEVLSEEHGLLLRALGLFGRYAERLASGGACDTRHARAFLRFFRDFGDMRHQEKEERLLFPWLEAEGLPGHAGPLAVLKSEHEHARDLRLVLSLAADGWVESPRDFDGRQRFRSLALRFVELMTAHIEKEEQVLFPLADRLPRQGGAPPPHPDFLPKKELEWLAQLEAEAVGWPLPELSLAGLGTPYGFECLCEKSLA
jgi:hemerythrin-like domain-containing protein